ncbi:hypothetical protein Tco_1565359 [Tanacetum coccineum]
MGSVVVLLGECTNEGSGEGEGEGKGEGEGEGEWEGKDVILEGEVEGLETSSIVGNKATSWPEYPFVGLFILLKTLILREGTGLLVKSLIVGEVVSAAYLSIFE